MRLKEQDFALEVGLYGCYYLCLKHIAEKYLQRPIYLCLLDYEVFKTYGWIGEECYIHNPELILKYWTGKDFTVTKHSGSLEDKDLSYGDNVIYNYVYNGNNHFCMSDYGCENSICRQNGKVKDIRIIRIKNN